MDFSGRHAIVTGGSSGIGRAVARLLVEHGAHVSIAARRQELLDETLAELESIRADPAQRLCARSVDLANWDETREAIQSLISQTYPPDLLFNVAGFCIPGYFQDLSIDVFRDTMTVNFFGTVNATKAVIPVMVERGQGHIVNFSSEAGFLSVFGYSAYSASKFAVCGFSEALRQEMRPHGIHVSVVYPPNTDTPGFERENRTKPLETKLIEGQVGVQTADQVARAVLRGVARRRRRILPGGGVGLHLSLVHLPVPIYDLLVWLFMDRIIAQVHHERSP